MPFDIREATHARRFARIRFGPTLFRCRACQHDQGWQLKCRPRVWQCRRCRRQQSVTSDTILQSSKLPLEVFFSRLARADEHDLCTSSALAAEHGIARSTAWHLNQRIMAITAAHRPAWPPQGLMLVEDIKCRRPKLSPPIHPDAPKTFRTFRAQFMHKRAPLRASVSVEVLHRRLAPFCNCVGYAERAEVRKRFPESERYHLPFAQWLKHRLNRVWRSVSLRWLPRYVAHALFIWNRVGPHRGIYYSEPALVRAAHSRPSPLHRLRPWGVHHSDM